MSECTLPFFLLWCLLFVCYSLLLCYSSFSLLSSTFSFSFPSSHPLPSLLLSFLPAVLASGKQYIQSLLGDTFTEEDIVEALRTCNLKAEVALNALLTQRSSRPHTTKETTTEGKSRSFAPKTPASSKG